MGNLMTYVCYLCCQYKSQGYKRCCGKHDYQNWNYEFGRMRRLALRAAWLSVLCHVAADFSYLAAASSPNGCKKISVAVMVKQSKKRPGGLFFTS
jgi:hypothetical protein